MVLVRKEEKSRVGIDPCGFTVYRDRKSLNRTYEGLDVVECAADAPEEVDVLGTVEVPFPELPTEAFGLNARVVFDASAHSIPPHI